MSSSAKPKSAPKKANEMSYQQMILETFRDEKLRRSGGTKTAVQKACFLRFNLDASNNHKKTAFTSALKKVVSEGKISAINNKTKEASTSMASVMRFKLTPETRKMLFNPPKDKKPKAAGEGKKAAARKAVSAAKKGRGRPKKAAAAAAGAGKKKAASKPRPSAKSPSKVARKAKTNAAKKVAKKQVKKK